MSASKEKLSTSLQGLNHRIVNLELASFCVFNSSLGQKEGEEEQKIFLFFPASTDLDVQIRHIGLLEAVTKFVRSFSDTDCRSFLSAQQLHVLLQAETDFWLSMTFNLVHPADSAGPRVEENDRTRNEAVQDEVYRSILEKAYKLYKILNGPLCLENNNAETAVIETKQKLLAFFSDYLQKTPFGPMDVLQCFDALLWLPLDRKAFLAVQNAINSVMTQFSEVKHSLALYWDQVIWNDIDLSEALSLVHYITKFLYPDLMEKDIQAGIHSSSSPQPFMQGLIGRFFCGPKNLRDTEEVSPVFVYLSDPKTGLAARFRLVVYSAASTVVCLFLQDDAELPYESSKYFRSLDACLGPALTALAPDLADQCTKQRTPQWESPNVRYVYLSESSLSKRQTLVDRNQTVQVELLKAMVGLSDDINSRFDDTEIYAKVLHDCWIYGKRNFQRSLYAVVTQRNADLVLAEEEIRKLCSKEFPASSDAYL